LYDSAMLNRLAAEIGERERLEIMFGHAPGFMALLEGRDHKILLANHAFAELVGDRDLIGKTFAEALPELAEQGLIDTLDSVALSNEAFVQHALAIRVARAHGALEEILVDIVFQPLPGAEQELIFVQGHNVTGDQRSETLRKAHNKVLELAVSDSPLEETLGELIRIVEATSSTGVLGSILLLDADGIHLRHGAAPSLPPAYNEAIDGAEIGPCVGSCGTAAYTGMPVFVADIENDPLWVDFKAVALPHGLRACWSTPILTAGGRVLGTFAMYHKEPREPTVRDLALVDLVTQTASLVIDREQAKAALRDIAEVAGLSAVYP